MQRLALIGFGVLLGLCLAEIGLQLLRLGNLATLEVVPAAIDEDPRHVVVCVGDSHTAGFGVIAPIESYPAQLSRTLNRADPEGPFLIENHGVPGMNTLLIVDTLKRRCAVSRPDLVLLLGGFNNSWSAMSTESGPPVMLWRLWRLWLTPRPKSTRQEAEREGNETFVRRPDGTRVPVSDPNDQKGLRKGDELRETVERDLTEAVEFCRRHGIPLVLQTYASTQSDNFVIASDAARAVAQRTGTPLVDHARWFQDHQLDPAVFLQPDGHPTARGYGEMAKAIHTWMRTEAPTSWPVPAAQSETADTSPRGGTVALSRAETAVDGSACFQLRGTPGRAWLLGVSRNRNGAGTGMGLVPDDAFQTCQGMQGFSGHLDDDGLATARVHPEVAALLGDGPFHVQALLLNEMATDPTQMVSAASEILSIERWD